MAGGGGVQQLGRVVNCAGALLPDGTFVPFDEWVDRFPASHAGVRMLYELTERERHVLVDGQALVAPHVVEFRRGGSWYVECSGRCTPTCPVVEAVGHDMTHRTIPPRAAGRYPVNLRDNGTPEYGAEPLPAEMTS